MNYEVLGAMIFRGMHSMLKRETITDLEFVDTHGLEVACFSYKASGIAASALKCDANGQVVVTYKVLGDIPQGVTITDVREMLKRNTRILAFFKDKGATHSAIAIDGDIDLDMIETLCMQIANSTRDRDSQKKACYKVCDFLSPQFGTIGIKDGKALVARICEDYKIPASKIEFRSNLESVVADGHCYTLPFDTLHSEPAFNIIACRGGSRMSRDTLIHEMAHLIARYEYESDKAIGHGPAFMAIYYEMLARYGFDNPVFTQRQMVDKFMELATKFNVKVDAHCILVDGEWYAPKPKKRGVRGSKRATV